MPGPKRGAPNAGRPNRSGIDWNDPAARKGYFRQRRAAYTSGASPDLCLGRNRTEAAYTIRISYHKRSYSYRLRIGKALYEAIGSPPIVRLDTYRVGSMLYPCDEQSPDAYHVDFKRNTTPTISVGEDALTSVGLTTGTYHASAVSGREIRITTKEINRVLYRKE